MSLWLKVFKFSVLKIPSSVTVRFLLSGYREEPGPCIHTFYHVLCKDTGLNH